MTHHRIPHSKPCAICPLLSPASTIQNPRKKRERTQSSNFALCTRAGAPRENSRLKYHKEWRLLEGRTGISVDETPCLGNPPPPPLSSLKCPIAVHVKGFFFLPRGPSVITEMRRRRRRLSLRYIYTNKSGAKREIVYIGTIYRGGEGNGRSGARGNVSR